MSHILGTLKLVLVALLVLFSGYRSFGSLLWSWLVLLEDYLGASWRERERERGGKMGVEGCVGCSVSFCRGKDTQLNGFMHGVERYERGY